MRAIQLSFTFCCHNYEINFPLLQIAATNWNNLGLLYGIGESFLNFFNLPSLDCCYAKSFI